MNYCTRQEVREMLKDDAMNIVIGDQYIEDPAKREELIGPIIDAAVEDARGRDRRLHRQEVQRPSHSCPEGD